MGTWTEGWEHGAGDWTVWDGQQSKGKSNTGNYSFKVNANDAASPLARIDFGRNYEPSWFHVYWWEDGTNKGGGIRLNDDGGSNVCGIRTDNPRAELDHDDGDSGMGNGSYESWEHVEVEFDWNQKLVKGHRSGNTTGWEPMKDGSGIGQIVIEHYDSNDGGWGGGAGEGMMFYDDLKLEGITLPPDGAPSGLSATVADGDVDLAWNDNSTNEDGFRIYRGTSSDSLSRYDTTGGNSTSYTDTAVAIGQTYHYRVSAYNAAGESTRSNEASATRGATLDYYDGSSFQRGTVKYWDGSGWQYASAVKTRDEDSWVER